MKVIWELIEGNSRIISKVVWKLIEGQLEVNAR